MSTPAKVCRPDLEQLNELEARLEEERVRLRQLRETLEQHQSARGTGARPDTMPETSIDALSKTTGETTPQFFSTASHNVMAAALLLRAMPEPSTPEGRRVCQGLRGLLEQAVVQNAESSASQSHDTRARRPEDQPPPNKAKTVQGSAPLIRKGALRPHLSTSASGPLWMLGPPSRPTT